MAAAYLLYLTAFWFVVFPDIMGRLTPAIPGVALAIVDRSQVLRSAAPAGARLPLVPALWRLGLLAGLVSLSAAVARWFEVLRHELGRGLGAWVGAAHGALLGLAVVYLWGFCAYWA